MVPRNSAAVVVVVVVVVVVAVVVVFSALAISVGLFYGGGRCRRIF